jgi:hypothetical protein
MWSSGATPVRHNTRDVSMRVFEILAAVETSALSEWIRGDIWAFPVILVFHTIGLAFLVGVNVAVGARILGGAARVPLASLEPYFLVAWIGFWLNAVSGVLLLIGYPAKAITNPLFYLKLIAITIAVSLMQVLRHHIRVDAAPPPSEMPARVKHLAIVSLACWAFSIIAGRLLAYTHSRLMSTDIL